MPGRIHIARRPQPVAGRTRFGDWRRIWSALREARRRLSSKERKSRFLLPAKAQNKTAAAFKEAPAPGLCEQPPALRQALAPDNGSKMVQFKKLDSATDLHTSFCRPHSPWQRGTNENETGFCGTTSQEASTCTRSGKNCSGTRQTLNERPRTCFYTTRLPLKFLTLPSQLHLQVACIGLSVFCSPNLSYMVFVQPG